MSFDLLSGDRFALKDNLLDDCRPFRWRRLAKLANFAVSVRNCGHFSRQGIAALRRCWATASLGTIVPSSQAAPPLRTIVLTFAVRLWTCRSSASPNLVSRRILCPVLCLLQFSQLTQRLSGSQSVHHGGQVDCAQWCAVVVPDRHSGQSESVHNCGHFLWHTRFGTCVRSQALRSLTTIVVTSSGKAAQPWRVPSQTAKPAL
jgi:hypothetical protein